MAPSRPSLGGCAAWAECRAQAVYVNLMLSVLVVCTAVGLFSPQFGPRTYWLLAGVAIVMTALYFYFPQRFM